MKKFIQALRQQLYAKPAPGGILNNLTHEKLEEISKGYNYNQDALWIGTYLADLFITEALEKKDLKLHVPMAVEYAKQTIKRENISESDAEIILEIIKTHHGGEQKHIESRLFKNADCFRFLDPKGVLHIFSSFYNNDEESFEKAAQYAMFKVEEKYNLVDLNENLKKEAKELYERWQWMFKRMGYKMETPDLYK